MVDVFIRALQIIVALGLLNVWLLRAGKSTAYRGGDAKTLKEEFATYGLPGWFCSVVGILKVGSAILLLVGLWFLPVLAPVSLLISILMVGAVAMHVKVRDPISKAIPAAGMLLMSATIFCYYAPVFRQL